MLSPKIESVTVAHLKTRLDSGEFAVPKLQRAFVWDGRKAAKLLDSIYRAMPIGVLTMWDTSASHRDLLREGAVTALPPFQSHHDHVIFVLDGQQRLSVLYQIFGAGTVQNEKKQTVEFRNLVFAAGPSARESLSEFAYRKPVQGEWVSVHDLLTPNWAKRIGPVNSATSKRLSEARERLLKYKVPLTTFSTESIDEAREIFIRINSAGTPIKSADRAFASASRFDLRHHVEKAARSLPPDFDGIPKSVLLQTRAILDGIEDVGDEAMSASAKKWDAAIEADKERGTAAFSKAWDIQVKAMRLAIDLLRDKFCVYDETMVPSTNMITTLTVFFVHAKCRAPKMAQMVEIRKWFWATALGNRYSGRGYRLNIRRDTEFFKRLAVGEGIFKIADRIDRDEIGRAVYGSRSSIANAFFCLLAMQRPRLPEDGSPISLSEAAAAANRKHKHHIFPREHLRREGVSQKVMNSILNLCFIPAHMNSQFGSKAPHKYLEPYKPSRHFAAVMRSHLIPAAQDSGVWDGSTRRGYPIFLQQREAAVCAAFEEAAGAKLFRSGSRSSVKK